MGWFSSNSLKASKKLKEKTSVPRRTVLPSVDSPLKLHGKKFSPFTFLSERGVGIVIEGK